MRPPPPNCASCRLQVLVQELEQYQVCAPRRSPRPTAPSPGPRPTAPVPRSVVTPVRLVSLQLLPKRLDWEGNEHNRSYEELVRLLSPVRCFRAPAPIGAPARGRSDSAALGGVPGTAGLPQ